MVVLDRRSLSPKLNDIHNDSITYGTSRQSELPRLSYKIIVRPVILIFLVHSTDSAQANSAIQSSLVVRAQFDKIILTPDIQTPLFAAFPFSGLLNEDCVCRQYADDTCL